MKILINASTLKTAGGLNVAVNLFEELCKRADDNNYLVVVPPNREYDRFSSDKMQLLTVPKHLNFIGARIILDHIWLPTIAKKYNPDVIFSMGNFAVPVTKWRQAVLLQWAYAVYPNGDFWNKMPVMEAVSRRLRVHLFKVRLKYADLVFPQTRTIASRLSEQYGNDIQDIEVVPNAFRGSFDLITSRRSSGFDFSVRTLLYLTKYYPHKNVEILIEVGKRIRELSLPYRILITIDELQGSNASKFIKNIRKNKLGGIIEAIGYVSQDKVIELYQRTDAIIFPTLLESYSAVYVDAMKLGLPIFTSDRDFAWEICGDAAFYFNPHDSEDILQKLNDGFNNPLELERKVEIGLKLIKSMKSWEEVAVNYLKGLEKLAPN